MSSVCMKAADFARGGLRGMAGKVKKELAKSVSRLKPQAKPAAAAEAKVNP